VSGVRQSGTTVPVLASSRHEQAEEDLLAFLLIHTWTLITGRVLRSDVPLEELSEEELIAFWADDHIDPPAGGVRRTSTAGRR
jgi:hypothetical protein